MAISWVLTMLHKFISWFYFSVLFALNPCLDCISYWGLHWLIPYDIWRECVTHTHLRSPMPYMALVHLIHMLPPIAIRHFVTMAKQNRVNFYLFLERLYPSYSIIKTFIFIFEGLYFSLFIKNCLATLLFSLV